MKDLVLFVFNKFVTSFEMYQQKLESIINFITYVDILYTKATIAKKYNYCKKELKENLLYYIGNNDTSWRFEAGGA
jgi:DNA mismatch repair ATPase MutS